MAARFLRIAEARVLGAMDPGQETPVEQLAVRARMAPEVLDQVVRALRERELVQEDDAGEYRLTGSGASARRSVKAQREDEPHSGDMIFVLSDDTVALTTESEEQIDAKLDNWLKSYRGRGQEAGR